MSLITTFSEMSTWSNAASEQLGDPCEPICQLVFRWQAVVGPNDDALTAFWRERELWLRFGPAALPVEVTTSEVELSPTGEMLAYAIRCVTPGVWILVPSLNVLGVIHGFALLYGVPDPAPWEGSGAGRLVIG
jgi:hypothetical protein